MRFRILLLIWLAVLTGCQESDVVKFGDTTKPEEYSRFDGPETVMLFHVNSTNNTLILHVTFNEYAYFGLCFSYKMDDSDFNIIQIDDGKITVTDAFSPGGHQRPIPDEKDDITLLGYQTDQKSYYIVKYSRPLVTNDSAGRDMSFYLGGSYKFTYAYRIGSPKMVFHGRQHLQIHVILNNQYHPHHHASPHYTLPEDQKSLYHGIFLSIAWIPLVDLAIFVKYLYFWKDRLKTHAIIMTFVFISTLLSIFIIYDPDLTTSDMTSDFRRHYFVGFTIGIWIILHFFTGLVQAYRLTSKKTMPSSLKFIKKIHRLSGMIIIVIGKYNVLAGWYLQESVIGFNTVLVSMATSLISLLFFIRWKINKQKIDKNGYKRVDVKSNEKLEMLMHIPYNNPIIQACRIVIFNDNIYLFPKEFMHPGGMKLIQAVSGREIDRFLYGISTPELYPDTKPFRHPTDVLHILHKPIGKLQHGQTCIITGQFFSVFQMQSITHYYYYFYFRSNGGSIKYGSMDTCSHIGKYFTVRGFNQTRLFNCVFSQRIAIRKARERILERLKQKRTISPEKLISVEDITTSIIGLPSSSALANATNFASSNQQTSLPLIIKNDEMPLSFSHMFYESPKQSLKITGPHGRGLCLDAINHGDIVIFAAGTGLLPFLDLINQIFFTVAHKQEPPIVCQEYLEMSKAISGKRYHFFISVKDYRQLIMPDQMNYINHMSQGSQVDTRIFVRTPNTPQETFAGHQIPKQQKFSRDFMLKNVLKLFEKLEMVYICGPTQFSHDVYTALTSISLSPQKIFFV